MKFFFSLFNFFLDLLFPPCCCHCHKFGSPLCASCQDSIQLFDSSVTANIAASLHPLPFFLDEVIAAGEYKGALRSLILALKYRSVKDVAGVLGGIMISQPLVAELKNTVDCITYIPLHPNREYGRGFNQSRLLAEQLGSTIHKPVLELLKKTKTTPPQAQLVDKKSRLTNIQSSFQFNQKWLKLLPSVSKPLAGLTIILIDDVVTTGTTLNECARILKEQGATKILGLTVAHGS